ATVTRLGDRGATPPARVPGAVFSSPPGSTLWFSRGLTAAIACEVLPRGAPGRIGAWHPGRRRARLDPRRREVAPPHERGRATGDAQEVRSGLLPHHYVPRLRHQPAALPLGIPKHDERGEPYRAAIHQPRIARLQRRRSEQRRVGKKW